VDRIAAGRINGSDAIGARASGSGFGLRRKITDASEIGCIDKSMQQLGRVLPWEFIDRNTAQVLRDLMDAVFRIFSEVSGWTDVTFSTTAEAVSDWMKTQEH